jgi:hypothetical protein
MIIKDAKGNTTIEIGTDLSIIDKVVLYREINNEEVALVECCERKETPLSKLGLGVDLACREVSDEWLDVCEGKISEVLDYFEKRDKVANEKEFRVIFDEDQLPVWFKSLQEQSGLKAVKLYEFLLDLGIKS